MMLDQIRQAAARAQKSGWSLNAIARAAGVKQPVLFRLLSGEREGCSLETLERLASHFGMRLTRPRKNIGRPD